MYGLTVALSGLRFHSPLKYQHTLNLFALGVVVYLAREIAASQRHAPPAWLERAGAWSYSLYLTHPLAFTAYGLLHVPDLGYFFTWVVKLSFVLVLAYGFYRLVERPAHLLARRIGGSALRRGLVGAGELEAEASSAPRT
jgi:peptidoglycan/LPS O-acetylase OafA/YrhL